MLYARNTYLAEIVKLNAELLDKIQHSFLRTRAACMAWKADYVIAFFTMHEECMRLNKKESGKIGMLRSVLILCIGNTKLSQPCMVVIKCTNAQMH